MNTRFEMPDGLGEQGRWLWDLYTTENGDWMRGTDGVLLAEACHFADLLPKLHERAANSAKGALIELGIATDKFLALAGRLGLSRADRLKIGIEADAKAKATPRKPKTKLDGMTPESMGIVQPDAYRAK